MGLENIRQEIDTVDAQMKALFLKRMELACQVVETKKQTGGKVYVPEREQAIISARSEGIAPEYLLEYQAFIRQLMGISRTYQYSKMVNQSERLQELSFDEGKIHLEFVYQPETDKLSVALNAISLAGLFAESVETDAQEEKSICRMCISGDFSTEIAKAAILLILEENM